MNKKDSNIGSRMALTAAACAALALMGCSAPQALVDKTEQQFNLTKARTAAITTESPTIAEQAGAGVKGGKSRADAAAQAQRSMPVGRRSSAPFIGSVMVPTTNEDRLPTVFSEPFTLDFADAATPAGTVSLAIAMARLSKLSGVPIRIQPDVYTEQRPTANLARLINVAPPAPLPMPLPQPGMAMPSAATVAAQAAKPPVANPESVSAAEPTSVLNVDMRYKGTLSGYLNNVTDRLGLSWEYRDSTIVVMKFSTEMHEIFTFPGTQKFSFSSSGSGGGAAGGSGGSNAASASLSVDEAGELSPLATIEKAIAQMIADTPGSAVMRTDGSGRLMVKTSREMQSRVRDYIKSENNAMRRQAQIQFDIYSVTTDESDERGVNWSIILQQAGQAAQLALSTPSSLTSSLSGIASVNILGGNNISQLLGDSSLMIQAMNQNGYSAQHRPVSLLALNRQWGRISRLSTDYYLSETTPGPASATGVGAPGLKTDKVTTGDQYVAMPQILDDNTVLLKFGMSLSDLLGMFDVSVGTGSQQQKVQAPKLTAINAQFPVALRPGEAVAVTGLSRMVSSSNKRAMIDGAPMLGGSNTLTYKREHFIIFIRPVLM